MEAHLTEAITQCPDCKATFKVTEAQILIADGAVRCGACLHVFAAEKYFMSPLLDKTERLAIAEEYWSNFDDYVFSVVAFNQPTSPTNFDQILSHGEDEITAFEALLEAGEDDLMTFYLNYVTAHPGIFPEMQADAVMSPALEVDEDETSCLTDARYEEYLSYAESGGASGDQHVGEDSSVYPGSTVPSLALPLHDDPEFLLQDRRRLFTARSLKWLPGIALMIVVAIGQVVFFRLGVYAQMAEYRPTYVFVCGYLGCQVPEYENHDELRTRELVIRSHPVEPKALLVDVLLLNSGPFSQTFPGLSLEFYNVDGEVVASRVFKASEYLGGEMRGLKLMPAETEVRLSLEMIDPGNDALGYQMEVVSL